MDFILAVIPGQMVEQEVKKKSAIQTLPFSFFEVTIIES
jgi:hypothetical protein